jgi:hypothetical protein
MIRLRTSLLSVTFALVAGSVATLVGCRDESRRDTPPPGSSAISVGPTVGEGAASGRGSAAGPPPTASAMATPCRDVDVADPVSAGFFPHKVKGFCVDSDVKTYGERAKYSVEEICTTAFDGGCVVYGEFGRKRLVAGRYVDEAGKGATVEFYLWQFDTAHGAFGMYTKDVLGEQDPAEKSTPRVIAAGGAGAIGTGRAYVWKGEYLLELTYGSELESPEVLAASSAALLPEIAKAIGEALPGAKTKLASVAALPSENLIPNGVLYLPKNPLSLGNVGPMALGYYQASEGRYRVFSILRDNVEQAKDAMKTIHGKPGTKSVSELALGDESLRLATGGGKDSPRTEWLVARKGAQIFAVGDEEFALREAGLKADSARISKESSLAKMKALLVTAAASSGSAAAKASAATSGSAAPGALGTAKKK